jgi:hypothetical protein
LDTEIGCFLFTDPLPVKVAQHHNALQVFVPNITKKMSLHIFSN